jgi:hypothetical protein
MHRSIVFGLAMVVGCADNQASTATQQQGVAQGDNGKGHGNGNGNDNGDDDDANGRVISTNIRLAGGGVFKLTATQLDPDPIYMMYGTIKGETTSGDTSKDIEVRLTVAGPTAGATIAVGTVAMTSILIAGVTPHYANNSLPSDQFSLNFTKLTVPYHRQDGQTSNHISRIAKGSTGLTGGTEATDTFDALSVAFGLPSEGDQCDRLQVTYDVGPAGKLGDRVEIIVHDSTTGAAVAGAAVSVCFAGVQGPETLVTDANGVAVTGAPGGAQVSGVNVVAAIGDQQLQCQKGASCDVIVP